ncbi:MAG: hypothetical protein ACYC9O_16695 [Candidatus Latescibacterota bacterium]
MRTAPTISAFALGAMIVFASAAGAQDTKPLIAQAGTEREPRGAAPKPDEPRHFRWMFAQLKEYLKLDDATSKRFEPIFLEYFKSRGQLTKEQMTLMHRIYQDADNRSSSVKDLQEMTQKYRAVNRSLWQARETFYRKSGEILDERQAVKLIIYEDKVKDDLFQRMRQERGGQRGNRDMARPPAPPPSQRRE